jgi:hypothetical protein
VDQLQRAERNEQRIDVRADRFRGRDCDDRAMRFPPPRTAYRIAS